MAVIRGDPTPDRGPTVEASTDMTFFVIDVVGLKLPAPDACYLPNDHALASECTLTCTRTHRVSHVKPLNWHDWPRFRSILVSATVPIGRGVFSEKFRMIPSEPNQSVVAAS